MCAKTDRNSEMMLITPIMTETEIRNRDQKQRSETEIRYGDRKQRLEIMINHNIEGPEGKEGT